MSINIKDKVNIAIELQQSGQFDEAEKLYTEILKTDPNNTDVLNLYGLLNYQKNNIADAIFYIKKAIELKPDAYFYENLGRIYFDCEKIEMAINTYKKALELEPYSFSVLFNLASAYKKNKQFKDSIATYKDALIFEPDYADIYFNLGNIYEEIGDTSEAINYYKKAVEYNPNDIEFQYFLAVSYLKVKNFEEGWKCFEKRPSKILSISTQRALLGDRINSKPLWNGEPIEGKTLYVYYEAGLGDTIMFARYLPLLKNKCAKVLFNPQISLTSFFKENYPDIEIIDSKTSTEDISFDVHIPIMSLAYVLQEDSENIPYSEGYLKANSELVKQYKEEYFNNSKFKIGIKWQGNATIGLSRIIPLTSFYKLFDLPNTRFYSVQKDDEKCETLNLVEGYEIIDLGATFSDFSHTSAAVENLDLIICNDTSIAHLAGALGKQCWVLLPYLYNWRWHNDISYSPWYKSIKLFRQKESENWDEVFDRVREELKKRL